MVTLATVISGQPCVSRLKRLVSVHFSSFRREEMIHCPDVPDRRGTVRIGDMPAIGTDREIVEGPRPLQSRRFWLTTFGANAHQSPLLWLPLSRSERAEQDVLAVSGPSLHSGSGIKLVVSRSVECLDAASVHSDSI